MATFNQRNVEHLLIGKASTALSTGGIDTLNDGEVGIFTPGGTRLTAAAAEGTPFILVQGRAGKQPFTSSVLSKEDFGSVNKKVYAAATEKKDVVGFNGTSGALDAISDNLYIMRIHLDQSLTSNHGGVYVKHGQYKSGATTSQQEVAEGLIYSLVNNFLREPEKQIRFERLSSAAGVATTVALNVVKGSKVVSGTGLNADFAAGDYVRFGTAATDYVYKVVSVAASNNEMTLDVAYQGATATLAIAAAEQIATVGNMGIVLLGQPLEWKLGKVDYRKADWELSLQDFGTTAVTAESGANAGSGEYEQIAEKEWFVRGNLGETFRMGEPNIYAFEQDTVDTDYDLLTLAFKGKEDSGLTKRDSRKVYSLAIPNSTPVFAQPAGNGLTRVLEAVLGLTANSLDL
jgi:hypothetical protein